MIAVHQILDLWDYQNPAQSETQFRALREAADSASAAVLTTQVARSFGLRKDFQRAREILAEIKDPSAHPGEVQAWYWLEMGRALVSAAHDPQSLSADDLNQARLCYDKATTLATECGQDYLAIDAMHMMVLVDREPQQQLAWNYRTIEKIGQSTDPKVKKWLGPIHNNIGYALHLDGQYDQALAEFELSRKAYEEAGDSVSVGIADWMVAWTYRVMGRTQDALELQLKNEQANDRAGTPDFYVYDELCTLYTERGDVEKAAHYRALRDK